MRHLCHLTRSPLFQYIQAYRPCTEYHQESIPPYTDSVPPSNKHCCSILTQCTPSSPRNAQSSQLDLVIIVVTVNNSTHHSFSSFPRKVIIAQKDQEEKNPPLCQMIFSPILGWLSNKIGKIRPVRAFLFLEVVLQNI